MKKFPEEIFANYSDELGVCVFFEGLDDVIFDEGVHELRAARYQLKVPGVLR